MSWAAHELESYFLQKHLKAKVSYLAILLGCLLPDLLTKLPVYGIEIEGHQFLKAPTPYQYHRGWPGVGFTHSLAFGAVVAILVLAVTRSRAWFLGLLIGQWAHALTDVFDSAGTMLFFPFTTQHYSTGMWAYAAQEGRYGDAAAYYSSLGGVWDAFWLVMALTGFQVLRRRFLIERVIPNDPVWPWLTQRFAMPDRVVVAAYRAFFVYGACRILAWFGWARLLNPARGTEVLDWSWGGPFWVQKVTTKAPSTAVFWTNTFRGMALWAAAAVFTTRYVIAPLWERAQ